MTDKLNRNEFEALKIQAAMSGATIDEYLHSFGLSMNDVDLTDTGNKAKESKEKEEVDKTVKKSTRRTRVKKETSDRCWKKIGSEGQVFTTDVKYIETLPQFSKLMSGMKVNVTFDEHAIPYKEQQWPVDRRTIEYNTELIRFPKLAERTSMFFTGRNKEEMRKAYTGETRYYRLVTFEENSLHSIFEIGYIKVEFVNNKLKTTVKVKEKLLKESSANPDKVKKALNEKAREICLG